MSSVPVSGRTSHFIRTTAGHLRQSHLCNPVIITSVMQFRNNNACLHQIKLTQMLTTLILVDQIHGYSVGPTPN
jgi:hypothetical protein